MTIYDITKNLITFLYRYHVELELIALVIFGKLVITAHDIILANSEYQIHLLMGEKVIYV